MPSIRMYPARNGDAILIKDDSPRPTLFLVDAGYASTFNDSILPDLTTLAQGGCVLDLAVVTHVDADHITGMATFLRTNGSPTAPTIITIRDIWHNSLRSLIQPKTPPSTFNSEDRDIVTDINQRGYPIRSLDPTIEAQEISARQGSTLAALLTNRGYRWNTGDGTSSINSVGYPSYIISNSVVATVIGPSLNRLVSLRNWWIDELRRLGFTGEIDGRPDLDQAFELLCARELARVPDQNSLISHNISPNRTLTEAYLADDSLTNGSSISLIIKIGEVKLLLLADSWAEDTELAIRYLLPEDKQHVFDLIKVSHHGSLRNTSPSLLELIDSPKFLISSNGERHNHPDIEVLKAIVDRPAAFPRELHFNYSTPASKAIQSYTSKAGAPFSIHEVSNDWIAVKAHTSHD